MQSNAMTGFCSVSGIVRTANRLTSVPVPCVRLIATIGTAPVLVQTGTFRIGIRNGAIRDPEVYALKLNGLRGDRIPARSIGGEIVFEVDTAKLPVAGPTPFFEIVSAAAAK